MPTFNETPQTTFLVSVTSSDYQTVWNGILDIFIGTDKPATTAVFAVSVDDLGTSGNVFNETPATIFVFSPTTESGVTVQDRPTVSLSLLPQTGGEQTVFSDTLLAEWNALAKILFGDDESKPTWEWSGEISETVTYPKHRKVKTVRSRVEVTA